jgi:hypothetical protein
MPAIAVAAEPVIGSSSFTRNSEVMNAETSAWGRAIMAALAVDEPHVASREEVENRRNDAPDVGRVVPRPLPTATTDAPQPATSKVRQLGAVASQKQVNLLRKLARERNVANVEEHASGVLQRVVDALTSLTSKEASRVIESLMNASA